MKAGNNPSTPGDRVRTGGQSATAFLRPCVDMLTDETPATAANCLEPRGAADRAGMSLPHDRLQTTADQGFRSPGSGSTLARDKGRSSNGIGHDSVTLRRARQCEPRVRHDSL